MNRSTNLASLSNGTFCLEHRLPEDQPSPYGLVCCECHARLLADPPQGPCRGFWESQPVLRGDEPCSVFTLVWDNFQIRSLHPPSALNDIERLAREVLNRTDAVQHHAS